MPIRKRADMREQKPPCCIISTDRFTFGNNQKSIVIFANPKNSNVAIELVHISHANLSGAPVIVDTYNCTKVLGDLTFTAQPVVENINCSTCSGYQAKIAYGPGDVMDRYRHLLVRTLSPYQTYYEPVSNHRILTPGTNLVFSFETADPKCLATVSCGFMWCEKRLSR